MWTISHAFGSILGFARNVHIAPARTRCENHRFAFKHRTIFERYRQQPIATRRLQLGGFLHIHDVHWVGFNVLFQCCRKFWPFGFSDRNKVFNRQGV